MEKNTVKCFLNLYNDLDNFSSLILKSLYIKYEYLCNELYYHNLNKPNKIFKKKYNVWIREEKNIKNEIKKVIKDIEKELNNK